MYIDSVEILHVAHPMLEPWTTAYGTDAAVHGVMVRMRSGEYEGWSEANSLELPNYSPEYAAGAFAVASSVLAPAIVGKNFEDAAEMLDVFAPYKGNQFAKASLELAWWQLRSSMTGVPLHRLLHGGDTPVEVGEALGITGSLDELLQRVSNALDAGFPRIKLKVRPDRDLNVLREVRRSFPNGRFHVDGNCGYSLDDMAMFEQIDELGLDMIEQPLAYGDLVDHARLQREMQTPICLDESITSPSAARAAIELGACRIINVKPPRVGGLTNSLEIIRLCREAGVGAWVGSMLETSIGTACNLALATVPGITAPGDSFPSSRFYREEITERRLELAGPGVMRPLAEPSSALTPIPARLKARTFRHVRVTDVAAS